MRWPAEWEPHEAVWIGFPGDPAEWPVEREAAQREVAAFARAVDDEGRGERVLLVCRDQHDADLAAALVGEAAQILVQPFGDIWLRDTGPIITLDRDSRVANDFRFNGWGGKYDMAGDEDIAVRLALGRQIRVVARDWILEGGAIDGDGTGRCITTAQCLLNANRNQGITRDLVEQHLAEQLELGDICWLADGLQADHTDGHVDNLARFVGEGRVAIPQASSDDDPNAEIFDNAADMASASGLTVVRLPSVGRFEIDSAIAPASYMNFYIGNSAIVVPQYGAPNDCQAVEQINALFPDRKVVGLASQALLRGGGSFHCISQQIPVFSAEL